MSESQLVHRRPFTGSEGAGLPEMEDFQHHVVTADDPRLQIEVIEFQDSFPTAAVKFELPKNLKTQPVAPKSQGTIEVGDAKTDVTDRLDGHFSFFHSSWCDEPCRYRTMPVASRRLDVPIRLPLVDMTCFHIYPGRIRIYPGRIESGTAGLPEMFGIEYDAHDVRHAAAAVDMAHPGPVLGRANIAGMEHLDFPPASARLDLHFAG